MDYRELSETLYKVCKNENQWGGQDQRKIAKMEELLQKHIEKELKRAGLELEIAPVHSADFVKVDGNIVNTESSKEDKNKLKYEVSGTKRATVTTDDDLSEFVTEPKKFDDAEQLSFLQRVVTEQDQQMDKEIVKHAEIVKEIEIEKKISHPEGELKRYLITVVCKGLKNKPSFQIFKGHDIIDKDFRTDQVTQHDQQYYAVVDGKSKPEILEAVNAYFNGAYVSLYVEHPLDWIPPQYSTIWQDRTKIKI
jgi:hypothetical protein